MNELELFIQQLQPYIEQSVQKISATFGKYVGKRLLKVLTHFGTGITKYPQRMIERKDAVATAKSDADIAKTEFSTEMLQIAVQDVKENPERYSEELRLALIQGIGWQVEEVTNINNIVMNTTDSLLNNPPREDVNADQSTEDISTDWLNEFRSIACKKSSEDAQKLFSKVLDGEIRKPGSISLRALSTLADMNQEEAILFNNFCSLCIVNLDDPNKYLTSQSYFNMNDIRIPLLTGSINDSSTVEVFSPSILNKFTDRSEAIYKEYGFNYQALQLLNESRLIDDSSLMRYNHFWYNNELWGFMLPNNQIPLMVSDHQIMNIAGYALTTVGKELFRITTLDPPSDYFEKITEFLQDFYSVKLYKYPKY